MQVQLETSKGNIIIELDTENAPITTKNFLDYVNEGHYDGTVFHRVIDNFMVQGGGFTVGHEEKPTKAPIKLESQNGLKNVKYAVAMARTGVPDSATSQFFINVRDNAFLDYAPGNDGYAVFGHVVSGQEVVDAIKGVKTTSKNAKIEGGIEMPMGDWPEEDIVIKKAYVLDQ